MWTPPLSAGAYRYENGQVMPAPTQLCPRLPEYLDAIPHDFQSASVTCKRGSSPSMSAWAIVWLRRLGRARTRRGPAHGVGNVKVTTAKSTPWKRHENPSGGDATEGGVASAPSPSGDDSPQSAQPFKLRPRRGSRLWRLRLSFACPARDAHRPKPRLACRLNLYRSVARLARVSAGVLAVTNHLSSIHPNLRHPGRVLHRLLESRVILT